MELSKVKICFAVVWHCSQTVFLFTASYFRSLKNGRFEFTLPESEPIDHFGHSLVCVVFRLEPIARIGQNVVQSDVVPCCGLKHIVNQFFLRD